MEIKFDPEFNICMLELNSLSALKNVIFLDLDKENSKMSFDCRELCSILLVCKVQTKITSLFA